MSNNYKLILSNKWIYREIELSEEGKSIQIGTRKGCSMRFSREYFFDDFVLLLDYVDDKWIMSCADTSYILMGNEKMRSIALNNGDEFRVCFCRNNKEIFNVFCILDSSVQDFSRQVNLVGISQCVIGGNSQCNIFHHHQSDVFQGKHTFYPLLFSLMQKQHTFRRTHFRIVKSK